MVIFGSAQGCRFPRAGGNLNHQSTAAIPRRAFFLPARKCEFFSLDGLDAYVRTR
jgi:hypothetical protein